MAHRERVLSLYRQLFRLARKWQSSTGQLKETEEEKTYIIDEARKLFRKNKNISEDSEIREHVRECETRIELARHYRIPYPRIVNIPQSTLAPTSSHLKKQQRKAIKQSKPVYLKSYSDND